MALVVRDSSSGLLLGNLAGVVEREHGEVVKALAEALTHALMAGDALLQAQAEMRDEASFERWVQERGLHYRTAQKYMRLAVYRDQVKALPEFSNGLSMTRALLYLRGFPRRPNKGEQNEELVAEIQRLHGEGVGSREIATMLDCNRSTVRYHTDPSFRARHNGKTQSRNQRRVDERDAETVRRLELRGGPLQEAHLTLARVEDALERAKDDTRSVDERRDIQRAIDSLTESKHWLARAIRSDLDHNLRPKVKHALRDREAA